MNAVSVDPKDAGLIARQLLEIEAIKINYKTPFTWSSGWKSPIYCDNRLSLSYPEIRTLIKQAFARVIRENFSEVDYIAGVATAGIAQGALVADTLGLPYIYVRPKPKEHGMGNQIEGKIGKKKKVVLIEDLVSTGGSSLKAAQALTQAGAIVIGMAAIFTYGFDVAAQNFEAAKIPLICLSDFSTLLKEAVKSNYLDESQLVQVKSWQVDPAQWRN